MSAVALVERQYNRIQLHKPHKRRERSMNGAERKIAGVIEPLITRINCSRNVKQNADKLVGMIKAKEASRPKLFNSLFYQGYEPVDAKQTALNEVVPQLIPNRTIEEAWTIIMENFGIAESIVKRFGFDRIAGMNHEDAVCILVEYSLFETALFFDEKKGRFSTYAYNRTDNCRNEIVRRAGHINFSMNMIEKMGKMLYHNGQNPEISAEELAKFVGVNQKQLEKVKRAARLRNPGSALGGNVHDYIANKNMLRYFALDLDSEVLVKYSPENEAIRNDLCRMIEEAIKSLPEKEAKVLKMHFGIGCSPKTLAECGNELGVSREWIRQLQLKAFRKIRHHFNYLREYLD